MAIHPHYAEAILDGRKLVEFRKRPLAADATTVVLYATAPIQRIVGEFAVDRTLVASPHDLWSAVGSVGCIDEAMYNAYYLGAPSAVGILVKRAHRYPTAVPLAALVPAPAVPQSFTYLPDTAIAHLRASAGAGLPVLARLASGMADLVRTARVTPTRDAVRLPLAGELMNDDVRV